MLIFFQFFKVLGCQQNFEGQQQEVKGQFNDFGSGMVNRVQGVIGSVVVGLIGDECGQVYYDEMCVEGKIQQCSVEYDIQKQVEVERKF